MSEAGMLFLVVRYPHRTALARHARDASIFAALRRLEARGLVWRQRDLYRLTKRGVIELEMTCAVARLIVRARVASP